MYQAIGRGVQRNGDGTITVKVEFLKDDLNSVQRQVRVEAIKANGVADLKRKIKAELQSMKDAEQDVALNDAIVGVILGEV